MMRRPCVTYFVCWAVWFGGGCQEQPAHTSSSTITVAVSIAPQAWLVKQIGGQNIDVLTLVEPGRQPETYQPTDADVSKVMAAAAYFRIGVPFENGRWFAALQSAKKLNMVDMRDGIQLRAMTGHVDHHSLAQLQNGQTYSDDPHTHDSHRHEGQDPHIWLSPRLLKIQARTVAKALEQLNPDRKLDYQRNLGALENKLDQLDQTIRQTLTALRSRVFLVFHPAWGYFADDYGLQQIPVEWEGKQPTDQQLTELQRLVRREKIGQLFVQPQISSQPAQRLARAIDVAVQELDPLAPDVAENLQRAAEAIARSYESNGTKR